MKSKTVCRVCRHPQTTAIEAFKVRGARNASSSCFKYFTCCECNSLSILDIPENLSFFYKEYYSISKAFKNPRPLINLIKKIYLKTNIPFFTSAVEKYVLDKEDDFSYKAIKPLTINKSSQILDVGCGSGELIYLLGELGAVNAMGIDPMLENSQVFVNGTKLQKIDISEIKGKYDIIMYHHSFEHLINPEEHLSYIKNLLKDSGVCLIRIPNIDCYSFKLFKHFWVGIHAPYHIFLPSYLGMKELLSRYKLKIIKHSGEQVIDYFMMSFENFLGIADNTESSLRNIIDLRGSKKFSPWHFSREVALWRSMKRFVEHNEMCDCITYYISHE